MAFLARQLSPDLGRPVIDETGLLGSYDFNLAPDDPTNTDLDAGIFRAVKRLGLRLRASKRPVETFVIDEVMRPAPN